MLNSGMLDVAIGIIFIFVFLSLVCSVITEWIAGIASLRSKNLEAGIRILLNDQTKDGMTKRFYDNPLIQAIAKSGEKPSYIPSRSFALALMNIIAPEDTERGGLTAGGLREAVARIQNEGLRKTLLIFLSDAGNNLEGARKNIENWYDDAMDRVSGWYKRKAQLISFICAFALTAALNADTIFIANSLFRDPVLRAGLVASAQEMVKQPDFNSKAPQTAVKEIKEIKEELEAIAFPMGWSYEAGGRIPAGKNPDWWVRKIFGLLITSVAVSLGAPFWFDVLNKFVNIRASGGKPAKSKGGPQKSEG
jgi:hypothetical protein